MNLVVFCLLLGGAIARPEFFSVTVTEMEPEPDDGVSPFRSSIGEEEPAPSTPDTVSNAKCDKGDTCYADKDEFKKFCKSNYNGVVDGGRCFFHLDGRVPWNRAFSRCEEKDGFLAHFHTSREWNTVTEFLKANVGPNTPHWLGLKRDPAPRGQWALHMSGTYWYDDDGSHHDRLSAENTWIREHEADDAMAPGLLCFLMWDSYRRIGDNDCNRELVDPLCSVNNVAQTFQLVSGKCMTETPIDKYKGETADGCAYRCSKKKWCRSFNLKDGSNCELFSFVTTDTKKKSEVSNCVHYSYVP